MPYFIDNDTYTTIWRDHEYNAEVLEGQITLLPENSKCLLVVHVPNNKWTYDVYQLDTNTAENLQDQLTQLKSKPSLLNPKVHYSIVAQDYLQKYIDLNKYKFYSHHPEKQKNEQTKVLTKILPIPEISVTPESVTPKQIPHASGGPNLIRTSESAIHIYRTPNKH